MNTSRGELMENLVWKRFVIAMLPAWVEWMANYSAKAHADMTQKFILTHPYYIPPSELGAFDESDDIYGVMRQLFLGRDFIDTLTDKGAEVWYNSIFADFMDELQPYKDRFTDFRLFIALYEKFPWWFERVYAHLRRDLGEYLESQGRTFK